MPIRTLRRAARLLALLGALTVGAASPARAADPLDIDLELFGAQEIGPLRGCSVRLWQANKDPDRDRYAYAFFETMDSRHVRRPARIEISGKPVMLTRIATGGRAPGYALYESQLYRSADPDLLVALELKLGEIEGEAVEVLSGRMTVIQPGKKPFRVSVVGGAGCVTPAAAPPAQPQRRSDAAPAEKGPAMFRKYQVRPNQLPRKLLADAAKRFGCQEGVMRQGVDAWQLSEEAGLWDIPCEIFAQGASHVFAIVHVEQPGEMFRFLEIPSPPGRKRDDRHTVLSPDWNAATRTMTSFQRGSPDNDCGVYEVFRVVESAELRLVELREKTRCDGVRTDPVTYPRVWPR